jgi:hypothetical protein
MEESENERMSWDNIIYTLDFHNANSMKEVSYLGGEPTTHPDFVEIIDYTLNRGFSIKVFTSAIMPEEKMNRLYECIEKNKAFERVTFICNANEPKYNKPKEWELIEKFYIKFSSLVSQGFNIFEDNFDMQFLFDNVVKYGLKPFLRIGITHKILGAESNMCVTPDKYPAVVKRLRHFLPYGQAAKVNFNIDCGLPMCAFSDEDLGAFTKANSNFIWKCGPVVDIGPDMTIWPCFPLSDMNTKTLFDFNNMGEIMSYFTTLVAGQRGQNRGIYVECDTCRHLETNTCSGGCQSYVLQRGK